MVAIHSDYEFAQVVGKYKILGFFFTFTYSRPSFLKQNLNFQLNFLLAISSHYYATQGAYFWIGLSNLNSTGWVWSDGSTVDYLNFYQQQSGYFYGSMSSCSTSCNGWNTCSNGYCTGNNNGGNQFAMCQQSANTY